MTKMATMPTYGRNVTNLLLQNQKSYDHKNRHVALGTQALQSLYKLLPLVGHGPILRQGQIGSPMRLNGVNCYKVI